MNRVESAWSGRRVSLEFGGAMQKADIWVNGVKFGTHLGGYLPFVVDLTSHIAGHDRVTVASHLDNNASAEFPPGSNRIDFTYQGGFVPPGALVVTDSVHVTNPVEADRVAGGGVFVCCGPTPKARWCCANAREKRRRGIRKRRGEAYPVVAERRTRSRRVPPKPLSAGADAEFASTFHVVSPQLWHPDHPWLYTLVSIVEKNGRVFDQTRNRSAFAG